MTDYTEMERIREENARLTRERDAARAAALEAAAKLCEQRAYRLCDQDGRSPRSGDDPLGRGMYIGAHGCAAAIRELSNPHAWAEMPEGREGSAG